MRKYRICIPALLLFLMTCIVPVHADNKVSIPVSCTAQDIQDEFTYKIDQETTDFQTLELNSLKLKDGGTGAFNVQYTYPGTYHYKVSQSKGENQQITYDTTVYQVDVYVTESNTGEMQTEALVYKEGKSDKSAACEFVNTMEQKETEKAASGGSGSSGGSGGSAATSKGTTTSPVKTGDNTPLLAAGIAAIIALITALAVIFIKKRTK